MNTSTTSKAPSSRLRVALAAAGTCAGLLMTTGTAQARPQWSVGVGVPGVAVQVRGGNRGGHRGGGHYHGGPRGYPGYWRHPGWRGPGWSAWGPAVGIGIGLPLAVYELERQPVYVMPPPQPPPPPSAPEPVVYPRNQQSPQQAEADRRSCDRWATTQPAAMADASIFHRSVEACMDARGYTIR